MKCDHIVHLQDRLATFPVRLEWLKWCAIVLCANAIIAHTGCHSQQPIRSWDAPRLLDIKKEWAAVWTLFYKTTPVGQQKDNYDDAEDRANAILRKHFSKQDLRHLAATCGTLPIHENDQNLFTRDVLSYMVKVFVDLGDRDSLVKLLSTRCPTTIRGNEYLEYCLVSGGDQLKDPILILGEAYSKCRVPEVRQQIAMVVRRGFTSSGIRGNDDAEFVNNAMQWYEKEKGHLVVNKAHHPFGSLAPEGSEYYQIPPYDKFPPLFIEKTPALQRKGD